MFSGYVVNTTRLAAVLAICGVAAIASAQNKGARSCFVVDNDSAGFSATPGWILGTNAADQYGPNYRYHITGPGGTANWSSLTPLTGTYQISAWWIAGANRTPAAAYILPNGSTVIRNQQVNGGMWNVLGTISLNGSDGMVRLSPWGPTGYVVIADAIRFCEI